MATLPSHEQWMKDTYSLTSPRSEFLKKLDDAIKGGNREQIKTALDRWRFDQSRQGKDWRKSVRNSKGAVTNLYRAVNDLDKRRLSKEELEALKYISHAQAMALQRQFSGATLRFKGNTLAGMASGVGSRWQQFKTGAAAAKQAASAGNTVYKVGSAAQTMGKVSTAATGEESGVIRQKIMEFCRELCPDLSADEVFRTLNLGGVESFAADLTPCLGAITSGGKAVAAWITVARTAWSRVKIDDSRYAFAPGDPEAALDAVIVLLDREIAAQTAHAGTKTLAFTGKALSAAFDFGAISGPLIGLMELLAEIFQTIFEYARDYRECRLANDMLRVGALNLELFEASPILGCYFLAVQDHSTIINFAVGDYGTDNWIFDAEQLVAKVRPALEKARYYIHLSRLEIPGMQGAKGVVEENYSVKTGLDRVTGAPGALKDKIADRIDAWFEKPEKPPKVDKSRIIGYGSR